MMWNEINTEQELNEFLELYGNFHDSCLKELRYISGAFVNKNLGMHPINDKRKLYVVFQRQCEKNPTIEIEFSGLLKLNLLPNDETYTCEILDVAMFFENGEFYWGDSIWFKEEREQYDGTWICAKRVRWRIAE
ncbi:MAG: hypothetical protein E7409_04715 [Ruminococcaceae bacterium]|nr:hypothetical protein [Oscillospiraceae bacterium]